MKFKKKSKLTAAISLVLAFTMCFGATVSGVYAATLSTTPNEETPKLEKTESILIPKGANIITVPDDGKNVLNIIYTTSGNISIDNSHADKISAISETGTITIANSFAKDYIIAESPKGTVILKNTTSDGEIYVQDKNTTELDNKGKSHLSQSGYSKYEFEIMLKIAQNYAFLVAKKERLGTLNYVGEIFDLNNSKYTSLVVDVNADGKVIGYDYCDSPNEYEEYEEFGLIYNIEQERFYYDGKLVRYFEDIYSGDYSLNKRMTIVAYENGKIDVHTISDENGVIIGVEVYDQAGFDGNTKKLADPMAQW